MPRREISKNIILIFAMQFEILLRGMAVFIITLLPFVESINRQWGFILLLILGTGLSIKLLERKFKLDFLEEVFGLFLLSAASGIPFSWSVSNSINELLRYAVYFIVFVYIRRSKGIRFTNIIIIPAIFLSIISFLYLLLFRLLPFPTGGLHLFFPTFGHNHLAGLLLFALPISIYRYIDIHEKKWGLLTAFFLISLIFTYSRVAYIIVLFYLFVFFRKKAGQALAFSIVAISVLYISIRIYSNIGIKLDFLPKQIFKPIVFESVRLGYWKQAFEGFKLSPVFGTGLDTFRYISNRFATSQKNISLYAHNHFIQMFTESGIIGGSLFLLLIIFASAKALCYKTSKQVRHDSFPLLLGVGGSVLNNLLDYDWQIYSLFLYFWVTLGLLLPKTGDHKDKSFSIITGFVSIIVMVSTLLVILEKASWDANQSQKTASVALINNQLDVARNNNDKAMRLDPYNTDFLVFRGNLEESTGDIRTARKYFVKSILLSPYGSKEIYRELLNTYVSEAQKYFDEGRISDSKRVLAVAKELFSYLVLIDIKNDFHSRKAIGDAVRYIKNKASYYKFQPEDISFTYDLLKNNVDN